MTSYRSNEPLSDTETVFMEAAESAEKALACRNAENGKLFRIPMRDVATLGGMAVQLLPQIRAIVTEGAVCFPVGMTPIDVMKETKDGGFWGAFFAPDGSSHMVKWMKGGKTITQMPIDPTGLAVLAMVAAVNQKLDAIQETQVKILNFLEIDKESELFAGLRLMQELPNAYRLNWDNLTFIDGQYSRILDQQVVAQNAIERCKKLIAAETPKQAWIRFDSDVNAHCDNIMKQFRIYSMALRLYAFTTVMSIMLSGNFSEENLQNEADKVAQRQEEYDKCLQQCCEQLKAMSAGSAETLAVKAVSSLTGSMSNLFKAPALKNAGISQKLGDASKSLEQLNENKTEAIVKTMQNDREDTEGYKNTILSISAFTNKVKGIAVDKDSICLLQAA